MPFQSGKISGQTVLRFPDRAQAGAAAPSAADSLLPVLIVLH